MLFFLYFHENFTQTSLGVGCGLHKITALRPHKTFQAFRKFCGLLGRKKTLGSTKVIYLDDLGQGTSIVTSHIPNIFLRPSGGTKTF